MKNQLDRTTTHLPTKSPAEQLSINLGRLMAECQIDGVQLSKRTGIPVTTINRLRKNDANNNPTLSTLVPLADFFALTISQLIGDEPIPDTKIKGIYRIRGDTTHHLPLLSWQESINWPQTKKESHATIATEHEYNKNAFALIVEEDNWENLSNGTAILIDPSLEPQPRDYIIVHRSGQNTPSVKQLLFDEEKKYLKPLVSGYDITPFTSEHKILGIVAEFKKNLKKQY